MSKYEIYFNLSILIIDICLIEIYKNRLTVKPFSWTNLSNKTFFVSNSSMSSMTSHLFAKRKQGTGDPSANITWVL